MFALRSESGKGVDGRAVVLPRWLRRPVRMLQRLDLETMEPPRFAASIASAGLFALTGIYGVLQGGHVDDLLQLATSRAGFAIEEVDVSGNRETSEIDVLQLVGLDGWTSMVGFNAGKARERIADLPWVESVSVRKVYPATLEVQIVERTPIALWQQGSQVSVIEEDGDIIAPFSGGHLAQLPLLVGKGADKVGPEFIQNVSRVPGFRGRVRAYIRVAQRRWDLRLDNGVTVKLPEHDVEMALAEASRIDAQYALFSRDIVTVDLRLPDRLVVELTPEAAEAREEAFQQRLAQRKNTGARI